MKHLALLLTLLAAITPIPIAAADTGQQALNCNIGPARKTYGKTPWLVYSCIDNKTVVVVSDTGSPAMPFYFTFYVKDGGYRLTGEGTGSKEATAAAFEELKLLTAQDITELLERTRKVNAERLVNVMRIDEFALAGMRYSIHQANQEGRVQPETLNCVMSKTKYVFTPIFVNMFQSALIPQEISDAIRFHEGPIGKKYVALGFVMFYQNTGTPSPEKMPQFTDAEMRMLDDFKKTSAGQKLIVNKLASQPGNHQLVTTKIQELFRLCRK